MYSLLLEQIVDIYFDIIKTRKFIIEQLIELLFSHCTFLLYKIKFFLDMQSKLKIDSPMIMTGNMTNHFMIYNLTINWDYNGAVIIILFSMTT